MLHEQRPNESERLQAELRSVLDQILTQDPNGLSRILETLNKSLEPVVGPARERLRAVRA